MVYRADETTDPSAGLTTYANPNTPGAPGSQYSTAGTAPPGSTFAYGSTSYTPGQTYVPPAASTVGYGVSPTAYAPVAGETLYSAVSKDTSFEIGDPGMGPRSDRGGATAVTTKTLTLASIDEVREQIFTMEESELRELQKKFGVKPTGFADPATVDAVDGFLGYVSDINASGVQETWTQVLNRLTDGGKTSLSEALAGGSGTEPPFSGEKTTTSSQVRTLSPSEARTMAEQAFVAALGREPTKAERQALRASMNERAHSNPVVSETTTTYDEGEVTDTHTVTNGGPDFGQMAINEARSQPDYAEYQAATTYFDAMMSALAAPGSA